MRTLVVGDPQAPFAQLMAVLARHDVLDARGLVRDDVELVVIGDYFDYDLNDPEGAGAEGLHILRWLASQPEPRVRLLFGNHDAARVIELAGVTDARWADARVLARSIAATKRERGWEAAAARERDEWIPRFPDISTYGICARDYASFSEEQQRLVVELLLAGRFHLGLAGALPDGRDVLLTHAGVTEREVALLGASEPHAIARALDAALAVAVDRVRGDWERGRIVPLDLSPLEIAGAPGEEAAGLLVHRPAAREREGADVAWEFDPVRPRRFDPSELPRGLVQVAGHTGHAKCLHELAPAWISPAAKARAHGGIRTLRREVNGARYELGVLPPGGESDLILVDGELRTVAASDYDLLELAHVDRSC
ncbi:MAG TPA: metallophosphoesterase [Kofleriaceae bacterium]